MRPICPAVGETDGAEAMLAPMLDMYAAEPMDALTYEPGTSLIEAFPYFDAEGYVRRDSHIFPFVDIHGGCRTRIFYPTPTLVVHPASCSISEPVPCRR